MKKLLLNGDWTLTSAEDGKTYAATVPGCDFTDLLANGVIPDPFVALNEKDVQHVGEKDWIYRKTFFVEKDFLLSENVEIVFDGLDTLAEISLNGTLIATTRNAYRTYVFDVKNLLKEGENVLSVLFRSPLPYIAERQRALPLPNTTEGEAGSCHIRKPAYHFGWDWAPHLLFCGITGDVFLRAFDGGILERVRIKQVHRDGKVTLNLSPEFRGEKRDVTYVLVAPDGTRREYDGGKDGFEIAISSPELWWTHDLGAQPLYTLLARTDEQTDSPLEYSIGLRTLTLDRAKDRFGKNFRFLLNGKPVFARGANYVPADFFAPRVTRERKQRLVLSAKRANMNMLRVWGGAYYADDDLCDLCDRNGILLWQDFMFACSPFPYADNEFMNEVRAEIRDNVPRMRHHACLALWCGNNELEAMTGAWIYRRDIIKQTEKFFYRELPSLVAELDGETPYAEGSPIGDAYMKHVNSDDYGDVHLWKVWHGMRPASYLLKRAPRFCSEFGLQSFPCENTVKRMCGGALPASLDDPVLKGHQKAVIGNPRVLYYAIERFGTPERLWDVAYLSQLSQAYCAKGATLYWRTLKDRCNGALYWQLNDCWGVTSWAGEDYYGNPKAVHYAARHFNAPVALYVERDVNRPHITVINDTLHDADFTLEYGAETMRGEKLAALTTALHCKAQSATPAAVLHLPALRGKHRLGDLVVFARLLDKNGNVVAATSHTARKENRATLQNPELDMRAELSGNTLSVTLSCSAYAVGVELSVDGTDAVFSDNFFDMRAGETVTVTAALPEDRPQNAAELLRVRSLHDVEFANSRLKDKLIATGILLQPFNFVNWVYRTVE